MREMREDDELRAVEAEEVRQDMVDLRVQHDRDSARVLREQGVVAALERRESELDRELSRKDQRNKESDEKKIGRTYRMYTDPALGAKPTALVGVVESFQSGGEAISMNAVRTRTWTPVDAQLKLEDGGVIAVPYEQFKNPWWRRVETDDSLDMRARIEGLHKCPELNGRDAKLVRWIPDKGRYTVRVVDSKQEVNVRPENCVLAVGTFVTIDPACTDAANPLPGIIRREAHHGTCQVKFYRPLPPGVSLMEGQTQVQVQGRTVTKNPRGKPLTIAEFPMEQVICRLKCKAQMYQPPPEWVAMHEEAPGQGAFELVKQYLRLEMALLEPSNLERARANVAGRGPREQLPEPEPESTIELARRVVAADRTVDFNRALPQEHTASPSAESTRARNQRLTKQESMQAQQAMTAAHGELRRAQPSMTAQEREEAAMFMRAMETGDWDSVTLTCARCGQGRGPQHFCPVQNSHIDTLEDDEAQRRHDRWCISCLAAHYDKIGCSECSGFLTAEDFTAAQLQRGADRQCKRCQ
jgi:hypothetical protein